MSNADLIERLRRRAPLTYATMNEAADALELADKWIAELEAELERERMRLVACGVVAMADTPDNAKEARKMHPDYESAACSDVARRVDECIELRSKLSVARDELLRCKRIMLHECGIGLVNEVVLAQIGGDE